MRKMENVLEELCPIFDPRPCHRLAIEGTAKGGFWFERRVATLLGVVIRVVDLQLDTERGYSSTDIWFTCILTFGANFGPGEPLFGAVFKAVCCTHVELDKHELV